MIGRLFVSWSEGKWVTPRDAGKVSLVFDEGALLAVPVDGAKPHMRLEKAQCVDIGYANMRFEGIEDITVAPDGTYGGRYFQRWDIQDITPGIY